MVFRMKEQLVQELDAIKDAGFYKVERAISSAQSATISAAIGDEPAAQVLNFCANNYLGLANHPAIIAAAREALDERGFGMASVRFICGTQDLHLELEAKVSHFLGTEETILFSSCFDANGGVFESLFGPDDAIISDELNHASIIDGIRLSKAARFRYANSNMGQLAERLREARAMKRSDGEIGARRIVIVTDGVFSMDGYLAPLREICDLAEEFDALVMVDDSHAVGFMGETGAGTPELAGVGDRVDIYTGTFGKALGGASGGYVSGRAEIVQMLRQKARPYLFSNSLAPSIVAATIKALEIVAESSQLRGQLQANAAQFRAQMAAEGFDLLPGSHPIVPVMFGDEQMALAMGREMQKRNVFVTAFAYPVVPIGRSRIRVQLSAAHTPEQIEQCVRAFVESRAALLAA